MKHKKGPCDIFNKKFINDQGLALNKSKMRDKKKKVINLIYECDASEASFIYNNF